MKHSIATENTVASPLIPETCPELLICRFRLDGILDYANPRFFHFFGKSPNRILGHHHIPLTPDDDRDPIEEAISHLCAENPTCSFEHRVVLKNGQTRRLRWTGRLMLDGNGQPAGYQFIGQERP